MDAISECPNDLNRYLQATYDCIPGFTFVFFSNEKHGNHGCPNDSIDIRLLSDFLSPLNSGEKFANFSQMTRTTADECNIS